MPTSAQIINWLNGDYPVGPVQMIIDLLPEDAKKDLIVDYLSQTEQSAKATQVLSGTAVALSNSDPDFGKQLIAATWLFNLQNSQPFDADGVTEAVDELMHQGQEDGIFNAQGELLPPGGGGTVDGGGTVNGGTVNGGDGPVDGGDGPVDGGDGPVDG